MPADTGPVHFWSPEDAPELTQALTDEVAG